MSSEMAEEPEYWQLFYTEEGKPYFYNQATLESRWDDPREEAAAGVVAGGGGANETTTALSQMVDAPADATHEATVYQQEGSVMADDVHSSISPTLPTDNYHTSSEVAVNNDETLITDAAVYSNDTTYDQNLMNDVADVGGALEDHEVSVNIIIHTKEWRTCLHLSH